MYEQGRFCSGTDNNGLKKKNLNNYTQLNSSILRESDYDIRNENEIL